MADLEADLTLFFEHVSERRFSQAKVMINITSCWGDGRLGQGRRAALEGIMSLLNSKSAILANIDEKLEKIPNLFSMRMNTVWSDDFDKGYFNVWIDFIEFARNRHHKRTSQ